MAEVGMAPKAPRSEPQASGVHPGGLPKPIRVDAEVIENRPEGGANLRLRLRVRGWPGFRPGQFVMLSPGARTSVERSDPLLPRPMAVFRERPHPDGAEVEILYKRVGRGTRLLAETLPGQALRMVGPLGRAFPAPAAGERALLVAGGTGIASVYQLAAGIPGRERVEVLLGARTGADLMGEADFAALGVALRVATEDGSRGERGLVTALLEGSLAGPGVARVYTCGPKPMMERVAQLAAAAGCACVVSLENHMACGFGVCLGCAAPLSAGGYALVCRDGPAFDASAIAWGALP
ncbi:MAG: dihydroorotate dehydrogenase electron transfer subunit [Candidatus Limnocylindria bacterium]